MHPLADAGRLIAGRYRLQAPLGRGAMGVVWRARDQLLDRDVAVKEVQIADTLTDAERANAFQRTLREAKTAARLSHPAVVTVYDVCQDEGRPWIVMQLVHARSLDQVLAASGPLSPRRAAEMGRQLLSALSVAHAAGVMHRDVKPSNVLLGSDDRAVLTDFGIATFQGDPKLTQTGMVMGSPGFTAPERIRGEDASPASDLWSLGATLYAAVEGRGPFERRGGAITTMSAIINEDAPEPPTAGALGPVIAALLRREPADRPDAGTAARMIAEALPRLRERPPGAPAGYEPTVLSAAASPARHTMTPGPPAADTSTPAADTSTPGGDQAPAARTTPQQVPGGAPPAGSRSAPEMPPADFSSWYDPSPRSAPAPGPAWSGAAPPAQRGPAQGGPAWQGYVPERRQRSGARWKIAVVALAIVGAGAGAAAAALLHHNRASPHGGGTTAASSSPPVSSSSRATLPPVSTAPQIINAINMPAAGAPPSGFTTITQPAASNETAGFTVAAPATWAEQTKGYQTFLRDPADPDTNILIDLTPHTYPDMLREAQYIESQSLPTFPGYQRVSMAAWQIRGTRGAYWKFTWVKAGVEQEALDLLFVLQTPAGPQSYALYVTAPSAKFGQTRPIFDVEVETFKPLTS